MTAPGWYDYNDYRCVSLFTCMRTRVHVPIDRTHGMTAYEACAVTFLSPWHFDFSGACSFACLCIPGYTFAVRYVGHVTKCSTRSVMLTVRVINMYGYAPRPPPSPHLLFIFFFEGRSTLLILSSLVLCFSATAERGWRNHVIHDRSLMTIDPRIPTMPGRSTSGF